MASFSPIFDSGPANLCRRQASEPQIRSFTYPAEQSQDVGPYTPKCTILAFSYVVENFTAVCYRIMIISLPIEEVLSKLE